MNIEQTKKRIEKIEEDIRWLKLQRDIEKLRLQKISEFEIEDGSGLLWRFEIENGLISVRVDFGTSQAYYPGVFCSKEHVDEFCAKLEKLKEGLE